MGIRVLVSTRQEDWFRFRQDSLTGYEIIEPMLSLDEAKDLFRAFKDRGKVHPSVTKVEAAYEKVGEPHLLVEYVYLLTHGQMLEDRLRDQIREITRHPEEDTTKIQILRCASLAHSLGTVVLTTKLLEFVHVTQDAQQVLQSLDGEYLKLEGDTIAGLHWVRSDHLVRILHDNYPPAYQTALAIMDSVPADHLSMFIANALRHPIIDQKRLLIGLTDKVNSKSLSIMVAILDGIFEAGERQFFDDNSAIIHQVYQQVGTSGLSLLGFYLTPSGDPALRDKIVSGLNELNENFKILEDLDEVCRRNPRGINWCRGFLTDVLPQLKPTLLLDDFGVTGRLIEWCAFCRVSIPIWDKVKDKIVSDKSVFDFETKEFSDFALGLYRYDEQAYGQWFRDNHDDILGYLRVHTDTISIDLTDNAVSINFFVAADKEPNDQAVDRLQMIRHIVPFCPHYRSRGIWTMPYGLQPPVDDTIKNIEAARLPVNPDVRRNKLFDEAVEKNFLPDGFFDYQEGWYSLRRDAMLLAEWVSARIEERLTGASVDKNPRKYEASSLKSFEEGVKFAPDPPFQMPINLKDGIRRSTHNWAHSYQNFFQQLTKYTADLSDHRSSKLAIVNFKEAMGALRATWKAFERLFQVVPDYFVAQELNAKEILCYEKLDHLLYAWILDPPNHKLRDPVEYSRERQGAREKAALDSLEKAFVPLREAGLEVVLPTAILEEYSFKQVPIAIGVENPARPELSLIQVALCLVNHSGLADFFYILPLYNGSLFLKGAYRIGTDQINRIAGGDLNLWDFLSLLELPEELEELLPQFPRTELPRLNLIGNVNALLGQLPSVRANYERISTLRQSENRFDRQQHARLEEQLQNFLNQLNRTAVETRMLIDAEFHDADANPFLRSCLDFIEAVENLDSPETLVRLIDSGLIDGDRILGNLLLTASN
jgi:hypothetical protein